MNKERIDEIAMAIWKESESNCELKSSRQIITDFAHALLKELAKVSEPEAYMYHIKGNGKLTELAAIEYQEQFGETIIHKRALYSIPPQQPDLVAENERKEWALLMNADIEQLRQQLSAAQADNEQLLDAAERLLGRKRPKAKEGDPRLILEIDCISLEEVITAHKSRKE